MLCISVMTQQMAVMVVWKISTTTLGVNDYEKERKDLKRK